MPVKGSRYLNAPLFYADNAQLTVFPGTRARSITRATGVLEYTVKDGDRLDLLALYFYNDSRKWWRLLDANPLIIFAADLTLSKNVGETILIPRMVEVGARR